MQLHKLSFLIITLNKVNTILEIKNWFEKYKYAEDGSTNELKTCNIIL